MKTKYLLFPDKKYHKNVGVLQLYETLYDGPEDEIGWVYPCERIKIGDREYQPSDASLSRLYDLVED